MTPDGCVELVFARDRSSGRVKCDDPNAKTARECGESFVLGLTTRPFHFGYDKAGQWFGIRLRPAAAVRLFGGDLAATTDKVRSVGDLVPRLANRVAEILESSAAPHSVERVARAVADSMPDCVNRQVDRAGRALTAITQTKGAICLSALSRELGVCSRQLDRDFDQYLGICPKLFARISRFRAAWESSFGANQESWASIAYRLGYADQAHFCREFHEFSGLTPRQATSFG
ncbi:MAG: helix-turn-helix transcriptional regulator [Planctomycetes bacterium]|nr:helix-turn-helix transcriptional regulator [Planctomycetota bacterium]